MSKQMEALLMIAKHPLMKPIMMPHIRIDTEDADFNAMVRGRSGGEKAVLAWAWALWKDEQVPASNEGEADFIFHKGDGGSARDPFSGFGAMDTELQLLCLTAFAHRWGLKIFGEVPKDVGLDPSKWGVK